MAWETGGLASPNKVSHSPTGGDSDPTPPHRLCLSSRSSHKLMKLFLLSACVKPCATLSETQPRHGNWLSHREPPHRSGPAPPAPGGRAAH